jgi:hypothetical protein
MEKARRDFRNSLTRLRRLHAQTQVLSKYARTQLGVAAGPLSQEKQLKRSVAELLDGMKPWQGDRRNVNNLAPDEAADAAAIYGPERYERLTSIKKTYGPANMFRLNHNVMPAA